MFFVIPEMPSKTVVMLYKKLPDHFNLTAIWQVGNHEILIELESRLPNFLQELSHLFHFIISLDTIFIMT